MRAVDWTDARSRAGRREKDLRTSARFSLERSSRWRGGASPETKRSGVIFAFSARVTDQTSEVRGWREGCRSDWRAHCVVGGGAGSGQPAASSERDRRGEVSGHKTLLSSVHRAAEGPLCCARGRGLAMRRRGPRVPRVPASAGYGNGAALQITALVSGTGSILHDSPERSETRSGARGRRSEGTERVVGAK